ncbi:MAG TPA: TIGR02996 domain-containing protein [Planctomycetaceae bacterium]|nr:TIGR02996 domain-containing protein [Planctomycetaceae bacterium]
MTLNSAGSVSRREFLVSLGGATLGKFVLPVAGELADALPAGSPRQLVTVPTKTSRPDGSFFLLWVEERGSETEAMVWHPDTPEEAAEAQRFYEAARNYEKPAGLVQKFTNWLNGLLGKAHRSPEELALLRDIRESPDDLQVILRYADWLTARGDIYGEFIRVDCEMENLPTDDPRYRQLSQRWTELNEKHGATFIKPVTRLGISPTIVGRLLPAIWMEHGLVMRVEIEKPGVVPERVQELFAAVPLLNNMELNFENANVAVLAACPEMAQIRKLTIRDCGVTDFAVKALVQSTHLGRLEHLSLAHNDLGVDALQLLAESELLTRLKSLDLGGCSISYEVERFAQSDKVAGLQELRLWLNDLDPDAIHMLASTHGFKSLRKLDIGSNRFGPEGLEVLLGAPFIPQLTSLSLNSCELTSESLGLLANVPGLQLARLDLGSNDFTQGLSALQSAPLLASLEELDLTWCHLTDAGIEPIFTSSQPSRLKSLQLGHNELGDGTARAIAGSSRVSELKTLELDGNKLTGSGVKALAESPHLARLETLNLDDNPIGNEAATALANSPYLKRITQLIVSQSEVGSAGEATLKQRFGDSVSCY